MSTQDNALVKAEPQQQSLIAMMATRYNLQPDRFMATVKATIFPQNVAVSNEQAAAFLAVAHQYELNPFTKEIYAFPAKGGGVVPIVSIDGWASLINRQPTLDGIEFEDHLKDSDLEAVTCRIYRKDRSRSTEVTEYMRECRRDTEPWRKYPFRMLRHKALIQCARYAFALSGIYDPDEAERIVGKEIEAPTVTVEAEDPEKALAAEADRLLAERTGMNAAQRGMKIAQYKNRLPELIDKLKGAPCRTADGLTSPGEAKPSSATPEKNQSSAPSVNNGTPTSSATTASRSATSGTPAPAMRPAAAPAPSTSAPTPTTAPRTGGRPATADDPIDDDDVPDNIGTRVPEITDEDIQSVGAPAKKGRFTF